MAGPMFGTTASGTERALLLGDNGALAISNSIFTKSYDYMSLTQSDSVTDVYTTKVGGSGGTVQETVTVVYTDSTHNTLSSMTRA